MSKLVIPQLLYERMFKHLVRYESEHLGFFLCNVGWSTSQPIFLARDVILVDDADLAEHSRYGLDLELDCLLRTINRAIRDKKSLVEAHNHTFGGHPDFSVSDRAGFREFVPYITDSLKGRPYAATVWDKRGVSGISWSQGSTKAQKLEIMVVGDCISKESLNASASQDSDLYDRQIKAFGPDTQSKIDSLRIGIVGLGGLGSHVAQQLAYLGAKRFVLIDNQKVEITNLNRLIGATPRDIGKSKVAVISRRIRNISRCASVQAINVDLRSPEALDTLKSADMVFGCVDNDGARLILNELSLAYLIPYIDIGTEIYAKEQTIEHVGGRVNLVLPNGPCLHCMGQIDVEEARTFLSSEEELRIAQEKGYIRGHDEASPSVVSLNGIMASLAVTEFLNLASGVRPPQPFLVYDMIGDGRKKNSQWVIPQHVERNKNCYECSLSGTGEAVDLMRYHR